MVATVLNTVQIIHVVSVQTSTFIIHFHNTANLFTAYYHCEDSQETTISMVNINILAAISFCRFSNTKNRLEIPKMAASML